MNYKTHTIWDSLPDFKDWEDDLKEEYPGANEEYLIEKMYEINDFYLDDERANLNVDICNPILVIADLGLWNGRRKAIKVIESGYLCDCLYSQCNSSYCKWYVDENGDFCCDEAHHDGTNHYVYRTYRKDTPENAKEKIESGDYNDESIKRYTRRLGDYLANVYGFSIKGGIKL